MTPETGERIYSNDYADLTILNFTTISPLLNLPDATFQTLANFHTIVYVPVNQITKDTIARLGYSIMPPLYGLISQSSLESSGINRIRNIPNLNLRGQGVLIGILDTGIDYTNPVFRYADGTTRIAFLWDQAIIGADFKSNTFYGTEYTREQINEALLSDNPYKIVPSRDENGHGTMVAGVAGGNEVPESNFYGVAPDAEFVIVKLKPAKNYLKEFWKIPADAVCYQENDINFALEYLEIAANKIGRPMSICIALGNSKGPHNNTGTINRILSTRAENLNFAIIIAAGNEGNARRHYYGVIDPLRGFDTMEVIVGDNEKGFSMELWGDSPGLFAIDIKTPSGEFIQRILPRANEHYEISFIFEVTKIQIDYQIVELQSGDQLILFRFTDPAPGNWTFRVYGKGDLSLSYHVWLPMEGFISNNTFFVRPDPYTTILNTGNSSEPITVTAYNDEDDSLYLNASKGYTRDGKVKPDIAAPGVNIVSPTLNQDFILVSGSSPAAAHTAGAAAMILEWGIVRGNLPNMNTADVKTFMIRGARRNVDIIYPNKDWGYGILDVYNIFDSLRQAR